jgi:hypothetical protein
MSKILRLVTMLELVATLTLANLVKLAKSSKRITAILEKCFLSIMKRRAIE